MGQSDTAAARLAARVARAGRTVVLAISMTALGAGPVLAETSRAAPLGAGAPSAPIWFGGAETDAAPVVLAKHHRDDDWRYRDGRHYHKKKRKYWRRHYKRHDDDYRRGYRHGYRHHHHKKKHYYKKKKRDSHRDEALAIFGGLLAVGVAAAIINEANKSKAPRHGACDYWVDRCAANWGTRNNNFYGCIRYHGCD